MNCVKVWGGLRTVEMLRMELGLFEKDLNELYQERKVEVQLGSEYRNLRRQRDKVRLGMMRPRIEDRSREKQQTEVVDWL